MALRLAGEEIGVQENIEQLVYAPGLQDSGDLEAATRTVTVTSKPGTPDYSTGLTTVAPADGRLVAKRLCVRLQVTIDSMTAGHLYGAIHVNGVERKTFDFTGTGAKYTAVDLTTGQFNLGTANTLEVFLWVDSGNAVISVCELWQAVGTCQTNANATPLLQLTHEGLVEVIGWHTALGTGSPVFRLVGADTGYFYHYQAGNGDFVSGLHLSKNPTVVSWGTVPTDINYWCTSYFMLRRLQ